LLPNFFIVGAGKSGTTSLYNYLSEHPQIYMSPIKEPHYFAFIGEKPYGPWSTYHKLVVINKIADYKKLFDNVKTEIAIGEASVSYLFYPNSAGNIRKLIPNAKIIILLRNPIDRAFSNYQQSVRLGIEHLTFEEALMLQDKISHQYIPQSMYYKQVKRYIDLFGKNRVKIYITEDFKNEPLNILKDLFCFLKVDSNFMPNFDSKYNVGSGSPKSLILNDFIVKQNILKNILKPFLPFKIREYVRKLLINKNMTRYTIAKETRQKLKILFRDDVNKLANLIGQDLSEWLK